MTTTKTAASMTSAGKSKRSNFFGVKTNPMKLPTIAALLLLCMVPAHAAPETCGTFKFCARHFVAQGVCNGQDQLPILEPAWEERPITIRRVTIGLQLTPKTRFRFFSEASTGYMFAGNSYVPDIMALQLNTGTTTETYRPGETFSLPAKENPPNPAVHVDAHVGCTPGAPFMVWLIIYYTVD